MTIPHPEEIEATVPEEKPLPVRIIGGEKEQAAEFGSWQTFVTTVGNTIGPQQILPKDRKRSKARIFVMAGTGAATTAFALVGSRGQVMNNQGGQLGVGSYTVENSQELWMNGDATNLMTIVVLNERYG
ncbi:MAG: hypothetical protein ACREBW_10255 [Candidatus Micrarchaeaceae archaeon]